MPGELETARLLIVAGALLGDGEAMLAGWLSYYVELPTDSGLLAAPRQVLREVLPRWSTSSLADRRHVEEAFARSAFPETAAVLVVNDRHRSRRRADGRGEEIVAYAQFLRAVTALTDEYFRQLALGRGNASIWRSRLIARGQRLWPKLAWPGPAPPFDLERLQAELAGRFGTELNLGKTGGVDDLHMGHRVVDERRKVEQYGCQAEVRFLALDGMVSNGFESWAWDGDQAHGGWGGGGFVVQVRPAYAGGPMTAWRRVSDPGERSRIEREVAAAAPADRAIAASHPVAYLRSVALLLRQQGEDALRDELALRGLTGERLAAAWERAYNKALEESSIFAHEGRHAIDAGLGGELSSVDLEFRAKLSEVAFAPRPRLALGSIFSDNLGDGSAHGEANARALLGVIHWMAQHAAEVAGLDREQPLLSQLPKLTDEQLRAAFSSQDPQVENGGCGRATKADEVAEPTPP